MAHTQSSRRSSDLDPVVNSAALSSQRAGAGATTATLAQADTKQAQSNSVQDWAAWAANNMQGLTTIFGGTLSPYLNHISQLALTADEYDRISTVLRQNAGQLLSQPNVNVDDVLALLQRAGLNQRQATHLRSLANAYTDAMIGVQQIVPPQILSRVDFAANILGTLAAFSRGFVASHAQTFVGKTAVGTFFAGTNFVFGSQLPVIAAVDSLWGMMAPNVGLLPDWAANTTINGTVDAFGELTLLMVEWTLSGSDAGVQSWYNDARAGNLGALVWVVTKVGELDFLGNILAPLAELYVDQLNDPNIVLKIIQAGFNALDNFIDGLWDGAVDLVRWITGNGERTPAGPRDGGSSTPPPPGSGGGTNMAAAEVAIRQMLGRGDVGVLAVIRAIQHFRGTHDAFRSDQLFQLSRERLLQVALSLHSAYANDQFLDKMNDRYEYELRVRDGQNQAPPVNPPGSGGGRDIEYRESAREHVTNMVATNRGNVGVLAVVRTIQRFRGEDGAFQTDQLFQLSRANLIELALNVHEAYADNQFTRQLNAIYARELQKLQDRLGR